MLSKKSLSSLFTIGFFTAFSLLNANNADEATSDLPTIEQKQQKTLSFENEPVVIAISDSLQWVIPTVSSAELTVELQDSDFDTDTLSIKGTLGPCATELTAYDAEKTLSSSDKYVSDEEKVAQLFAAFAKKLPEGAVITSGSNVSEFSPLVRFSAVKTDEENIEFHAFIASHEAVIEGKVSAPAAYSDYLHDLFARVELEQI